MPATDRYTGTAADRRLPDYPSESIQDVVPTDTAELQYVSRALWIGTGGDVRVMAMDGTVGTIHNVPSSTLLPHRVRQVFATGTTASGITSHA